MCGRTITAPVCIHVCILLDCTLQLTQCGWHRHHQKTTVRHFGFTEEVYELPRVGFAHCYCRSAVIEMPLWECPLRCALAVEACRRRAASAGREIILGQPFQIQKHWETHSLPKTAFLEAPESKSITCISSGFSAVWNLYSIYYIIICWAGIFDMKKSPMNVDWSV